MLCQGTMEQKRRETHVWEWPWCARLGTGLWVGVWCPGPGSHPGRSPSLPWELSGLRGRTLPVWAPRSSPGVGIIYLLCRAAVRAEGILLQVLQQALA